MLALHLRTDEMNRRFCGRDERRTARLPGVQGGLCGSPQGWRPKRGALLDCPARRDVYAAAHRGDDPNEARRWHAQAGARVRWCCRWSRRTWRRQRFALCRCPGVQTQ